MEPGGGVGRARYSRKRVCREGFTDGKTKPQPNKFKDLPPG